jgi:hypothetical protein
MRTTLDIPPDLLSEAQQLAGTPTKTSTVIVSLQELVRARRLDQLRRLKGKLELEVDLTALRRDRTHA